MHRTLDELYRSISDVMIKAMPESRSDAILEVQLHTLAMKISGAYLDANTGEASPLIFFTEDKKILMKEIVELHLVTNLDEQSRWNTMHYTLHQNGQYRVDYIWNQELADDVQRVYEEA